MVKATQEVPVSTNYSSLFSKISNLTGKEKFQFCKTLSLDEKKAYVAHLKEKDCEMVKGTFKCFEPVGGSVTFSYRPYESVESTTTMMDGIEYEVPRCVARRLNTDWQGAGTWHPTNSNILDSDGKPTISMGKKNYRFAFVVGEF